MTTSNAQLFKDKGNVAFKAGKYVDAIGHYTNAILADTNEPTYLLNRAAAYLKLGKNQDAERDCTLALSLSKNNVKALYRRAQARIGLEKWNDSIADLSTLLKLDPKNEPAKTELQRVSKLQRNVSVSRQEPIAVQPTPLRRRVPVTIVDPPSEVSPIGSEMPLKRRRVPVTIIDSNDFSPPSHGPATSLSSESSGSVATSTPSNAITGASPSPNPKIAIPPGSSQTSSLKSILKPSQRTKAGGNSIGGGIFRPNGSSTLLHKLPQKQEADRPGPPRQEEWTLFSFTRALAESEDAQKRWDIIQQVPPPKFPSLFSISLESPILSQLLSTFSSVLSTTDMDHENRNSESIKEYMCALTRVKRFKTVVMFLSGEEKETAKNIWNAVDDDVDATERKLWNL